MYRSFGEKHARIVVTEESTRVGMLSNIIPVVLVVLGVAKEEEGKGWSRSKKE